MKPPRAPDPARRRAMLALGALGPLAACAPLGSGTPQPTPTPSAASEADPLAAWLQQARPPQREFRAAWVATVVNIDWPSRRGLDAAALRAEIRQLVSQARSLGLNALILQVRPAADALYPSSLEPWSEFLTGRQGQAPEGEPGYDPLADWLLQAHAQGLELHAWINPYRAGHPSERSPRDAQHISRRRPDLVRRYGEQLWLDPAEPEAAAHTLAVCEDLLRRYALDGLHIDDYFYPYPLLDAAKRPLPFPDDPSWQRHGQGQADRAAWRRAAVDALVRELHALVRRLRPAARFGISPFGLPQTANRPAGISGFSQYEQLHADVERWLREGWLDYLAPQLYWPRAQAAQAFEALLRAWQALNPMQRCIWPGLFSSQVGEAEGGWAAEEILGQIEAERRLSAPGRGGQLHFSWAALAQNRRGLAQQLQAKAYADAALPPSMPWLDKQAPPAPPLPGAGLLWRSRGGQWTWERRWPDSPPLQAAAGESWLWQDLTPGLAPGPPRAWPR